MICIYTKTFNNNNDINKVEYSNSFRQIDRLARNPSIKKCMVNTINGICSLQSQFDNFGLVENSLNAKFVMQISNLYNLGIGGGNINIPFSAMQTGSDLLSKIDLRVPEELPIKESSSIKKKIQYNTNNKKKSQIRIKKKKTNIYNQQSIIYKTITPKMINKLGFRLKFQISHLLRDVSSIKKVDLLIQQTKKGSEVIFVKIFYKNQIKKSFYLFETRHGKFFLNKNGKTVERILKSTESLEKYIMSSGFGVRWFRGKYGFHGGMDMHAPFGNAILSVEAGRVVKSERRHDYGNYVVVLHGSASNKNSVYTLYAHMSKRSVKVGDIIHKGQKLGEIGSTGWSTGPHLHIEFMDAFKSKKNPAINLNFNRYIILNKDLTAFQKRISMINNIYNEKTIKSNTKNTSKPVKLCDKNSIKSILNKNKYSKSINTTEII